MLLAAARAAVGCQIGAFTELKRIVGNAMLQCAARSRRNAFAPAGMPRESIEFDVVVVVVGAGPAGLAAACKLGQLARAAGCELNVAVVEKGSAVGAHIMSGAVFEPRALEELFPDWRERGAPLTTPVAAERTEWFAGARRRVRVPDFLVPAGFHHGPSGYHVPRRRDSGLTSHA